MRRCAAALKRLAGSAGRSRVAVGVLLLAVAALLIWRSAGAGRHAHAARQALAGGDLQAARSHLEAAQRMQPGDAEDLYLLGRTLRRLGELPQADRWLSEAERAGWDADEIRHQRKLALVQSGQFDRAQSYLQAMLQHGADDELAAEIYEAIAQGHLSSYRLADASL